MFDQFPSQHFSVMAIFLISIIPIYWALLAAPSYSLEFCGPPLIMPGGANTCPAAASSGLKTIDGRAVCCGYPQPVDGHSPEGKSLGGKKPAGKYCGPYLLVDNIPRCPDTHPYDAARSGKNRCCGDTPIPQEKGQRRNGTSCVDLSAPGRPSDCPANRHRCNDSLWRDLMTEQCPRTCGRCGEAADSRRGSAAVCRDGIGPNGMSECPENRDRCTDPIWRTFMAKECPKTCGVCGGGGGGGTGRRGTRRTTTSTTASSTTLSTIPNWWTTSTMEPIFGR